MNGYVKWGLSSERMWLSGAESQGQEQRRRTGAGGSFMPERHPGRRAGRGQGGEDIKGGHADRK